MRKLLSVILCFCILCTIGCNKSTESEETEVKSIVTTETLFQADIIYHVLKYIQLEDSPANLYDEEYINEFEAFRKENNNTYNLVDAAVQLSGAYAKYFDEVTFIAFCAFDYTTLEDTINGILNDEIVSESAKSEFIIPFIDCVKEEQTIYEEYWNNKIQDSQSNIDKLVELANGYFTKLQKVFDYTGKNPQFCLCISLDGEGRGITNTDMLTAAIEIPETDEEMTAAFFQGFHEMTHQFTDQRFFTSISMDDGTHLMSEKVVMMTDYYIFKELEPDLLEAYIKWTGEEAGKSDATEEEFLEFYDLPEEQDNGIETLLKEMNI